MVLRARNHCRRVWRSICSLWEFVPFPHLSFRRCSSIDVCSCFAPSKVVEWGKERWTGMAMICKLLFVHPVAAFAPAPALASVLAVGCCICTLRVRTGQGETRLSLHQLAQDLQPLADHLCIFSRCWCFAAISCLVSAGEYFQDVFDGGCVVGVVVSVFHFDGAMGDTYFCSPQLSCCPLHVGQNDDCLQIVMDAYTVRLSFGRVGCN